MLITSDNGGSFQRTLVAGTLPTCSEKKSNSPQNNVQLLKETLQMRGLQSFTFASK